MRKQVCLLALLSLFLMNSTFVNRAQAESETKIAYVDIEKALSLTKEGATAQRSYEAEVKKAQAGLDKQRKELESLKKDYASQRDSLSGDALASKGEKIISLEKDLKRDFQDTQDQLRRKNVQLVSGLMVRMRKAVEEIGKQEGLTMILEKGNQVLYANSSADITEKVAKKFDTIK